MFEVDYSKHFRMLLKEMTYPERLKITGFISSVQIYGLQDFKNLEGKIAKTTKSLSENSSEYVFAKTYCLWHYHIGTPDYIQKDSYKTSEYVVHFMWDKDKHSKQIKLVDPRLCISLFT